MAIFSGPEIAETGLVLCLDAANPRSYPGSGTVWNDLIDTTNYVILTNGPSYDSGLKGSIVFDGTNDYATSVSLANPNGQLTCEVGLNYDSGTTYRNIFERSTASRPMLWIDSSNKIEVSFSSGAGGITSANSYNGQNIVITATFNSGSTPGIQLFVNGNLTNTVTTSHVVWSNPSTFTLFNRSAGETFDGKIYFIRFYNRVLSAGEILQNYNATRSRFGL